MFSYVGVSIAHEGTVVAVNPDVAQRFLEPRTSFAYRIRCPRVAAARSRRMKGAHRNERHPARRRPAVPLKLGRWVHSAMLSSRAVSKPLALGGSLPRLRVPVDPRRPLRARRRRRDRSPTTTADHLSPRIRVRAARNYRSPIPHGSPSRRAPCRQERRGGEAPSPCLVYNRAPSALRTTTAALPARGPPTGETLVFYGGPHGLSAPVFGKRFSIRTIAPRGLT